MWHYTEGIRNWDPIWDNHGIRILPGPSSLWIDALGNRLPAPYFPGFDSLGTLRHILSTGYDYSWFVLTKRIIGKEFALSGSEQNPDLTGKSIRKVLERARADMPGPVEAFLNHGPDFVSADNLRDLVDRMNKLTAGPLIDARRAAADRHRPGPCRSTTRSARTPQLTAIRGARRYRGDKLIRVAPPHRLLDPKAGPLIAVRLNILTRKSLGGLETDLSGRVLRPGGEPLPGLYAAGEVAGFGGGGVHGYDSLEGTFLGGCMFSGRAAGRAAAAQAG